jgi:RNA polymerase-binding transcription factor DksA
VRSRLQEERRLAEAQISAMLAQLVEIIESSQFVATDDEHDPDGSTVAFERSKTSALLAHAQNRLSEVGSALGRLDAGTFGICEGCGARIPLERLIARPIARRCVRCAARTGLQGTL